MKQTGNSTDQQTECTLQSLAAVLPEAGKISRDLHQALCGLVRRSLLGEQQEAAEATRIYRPENVAELQELVGALPLTPDEEKRQAVEELHLRQEEKEAEYAYWAFRRQAANGELLVKDELLKFRIIRTQEYNYLLLCEKNSTALAECFAKVFKRKPDLFSERAFSLADKSWAGWIWILIPDEELAGRMRQELKELWQVKEQ